MKFSLKDRHKSLMIALKKAGFKVDEVTQHDKKTVLTVSPAGITPEIQGVHKAENPEISKNKKE